MKISKCVCYILTFYFIFKLLHFNIKDKPLEFFNIQLTTNIMNKQNNKGFELQPLKIVTQTCLVHLVETWVCGAYENSSDSIVNLEVLLGFTCPFEANGANESMS